MSIFYIGVNKSKFTMFGGTDRTTEERFAEHNAKGNLDKWEVFFELGVEDYHKAETFIQHEFADLLVDKEIINASPEEVKYMLFLFLGREKEFVCSPFASSLFSKLDNIKSSDDLVKPLDLDSLKQFQVREELVDRKHVKELKERIEFDGEINKPLLVFIKSGSSRVISGNHRYTVAVELELPEVPAVILPKHLDEKSLFDLGLLMNNNHEVGLKTKDSDIVARLADDINLFGLSAVKDNLEAYSKMFIRTKLSIGQFIRSARKNIENGAAKKAGIFDYNKEKVLDELDTMKFDNPRKFVSMVDSKDIYGQLGKSLMKNLENKKLDMMFILYFASLKEFESKGTRLEQTVSKAKILERELGFKVEVVVLDQSVDR